jgi:hypothetical protein
MWKNIVEPGRPQITTWRISIACWIPKATNTHSEYVILIFALQQWLHESASVLSYACIACLVCFYNSRNFWLTSCIIWGFKSWYPFCPVNTKQRDRYKIVNMVDSVHQHFVFIWCLFDRASFIWNNVGDQLDATMMIYWYPTSPTCFGQFFAHLQDG